jgi:hypothetical protein
MGLICHKVNVNAWIDFMNQGQETVIVPLCKQCKNQFRCDFCETGMFYDID